MEAAMTKHRMMVLGAAGYKAEWLSGECFCLPLWCLREFSHFRAELLLLLLLQGANDDDVPNKLMISDQLLSQPS